MFKAYRYDSGFRVRVDGLGFRVESQGREFRV
jgi:hypothetical protein